jgi:hypothetical protein
VLRRGVHGAADVSTAGPVVTDTRLAPGHDGRAEVVVELLHPSGATTTISVDEDALARILVTTGATCLEELHGRAWTDITPH